MHPRPDGHGPAGSAACETDQSEADFFIHRASPSAMSRTPVAPISRKEATVESLCVSILLGRNAAMDRTASDNSPDDHTVGCLDCSDLLISGLLVLDPEAVESL